MYVHLHTNDVSRLNLYGQKFFKKSFEKVLTIR